MNNAEIKKIALAYNELFKSTRKFDELRTSLEGKKVDDSFEKEEIEKIKTEYQQRLADLEKFEREFDKFEKFMPSEVFRQLKEALSNEKMILGRISADAAGYLELNDVMYLTSLMESFDKEKDFNAMLTKEMSDFSTDLGFNLLKQALDEKITLEDLKLMAAAFEQDSELYERIHFTIDFLERRELTDEKEKEKEEEGKEPEEKEEEKAEEEKKDEEVSTSEQAQAGSGDSAPEAAPEETRKPTLQEKLNAVNYKQGSNINAEVQELTADETIAGLHAQIEALESKEKLTIRETFQLRQLKEQELAFEAYKASLEEQKISGKESRRNKKLDATLNKIGDKQTELQAAIAQSQQYSSKMLRFFSSRYQQKLNDQLTALREKQGAMTEMQKYSAITRFDKKSKKIMRQAKRKGTIEQLKQFRDSILDEIGNIRQDVERFVSTKDQDMQELTETVVVLPDNVISLDEYRRSLEQQRVA